MFQRATFAQVSIMEILRELDTLDRFSAILQGR